MIALALLIQRAALVALAGDGRAQKVFAGLVAAGLFSRIGAVGLLAPAILAARRPSDIPVAQAALGAGLALAGPGTLALERVVRLPWFVSLAAILATAATVVAAVEPDIRALPAPAAPSKPANEPAEMPIASPT